MHPLKWLSLLLVLTFSAAAREVFDRPNVVLINLDDSGYGDYSQNGNPVIETLTISRLAASGANFTQFYVTSPACSASRYSLLTGKYPGRSGLESWVIGPEAKSHLRADETTIADGLKTRGYATAIFGKWHLGNPNALNGKSPGTLPLAHGFDTWIGSNVSHDYDNAQLLQSDPAGITPIPGYSEIARNLPSNPEVCNTLTERYTRAATAFIRANRRRPFFAYIAYNQPHLGLYGSDAFRGSSRRGRFGDIMAELDDSVAQIMKALEDNGIAKNTLVIFSSDNGPWILYQNTVSHPKYGEARLNIGYAQPFRDGKGSNWEGGHRVPGIFYWPGVIEPHRQLEPASTLDVLPTVFALCGVTANPKVDGRDIRALLSERRFNAPFQPFELAYSGVNNQPAAFREGPWKLHIHIYSQTGDNYGFTASPEKPLLFNVEQDLGERFDRAAEQPAIVARLRKKIEMMTVSIKVGQ